MPHAVQKIEREFGIDKHSPLHAGILAACKRKRICVNIFCKKRLKFVDYLEMNVEAEDVEPANRFQDSIERLTRVWNDTRVELYCCSCFEPTTGINDMSTGLAKQRDDRRPTIKIRNILFAFVLFMASTAIIMSSMVDIIIVPFMVAGIIAGIIVGIVGMMLFCREVPR